MEWIESMSGLGAIGIAAVVLLVVAKALFSKSSDTAALIAVMNRLVDQSLAQVTQNGQQLNEMQALRQDELNRESRAQERHENIIQVLKKMLADNVEIIKFSSENVVSVAELSEKMSTFEATMNEHTRESTALEAFVKLLNELRADVNQIKDDITQVKVNTLNIERNIERLDLKLHVVEQQAETVKTTTQENPVIEVTPPPPVHSNRDKLPGGSIPVDKEQDNQPSTDTKKEQ